MATKDLCLSSKDKQDFFTSDSSNGQYSNLNLNHNIQCSPLETVTSKNFNTNYTRKAGNYANLTSENKVSDFFEVPSPYLERIAVLAQSLDLTCVNDLQKRNDSRCNSENNNLSSNIHKQEETCRKETVNQSKDSNNLNSSTLSLHIIAYENSIEGVSAEAAAAVESSNNCNNKNNGLIKKWKNAKESGAASVIQASFEFPRQQEENHYSNPEVMQFKASQQLLNPTSGEASAMARGYSGFNPNSLNEVIAGMDAMEIDAVDDNDGDINTITTYSSNVAAMLASVKNFNEEYLDILEVICMNNNPAIVESLLTTDMLYLLTLDYKDDCYTATLKFNIFIHLMHIEECLRVIKPIVKDKRCSSLKSLTNNKQMRMEFDMDNPTTLTNSCVLFCPSNVLSGNGAFFTYEGRATTFGDKLSIDFKCIKDHVLDVKATFTVFEKPFESGFDAWQFMIRQFREKNDLSQKFFGPIQFMEPLDAFLQTRDREKALMFADEEERFLNPEQRDAVYSMKTQDPRNTFVLFGPPGTGKTTTLVEAVRMIRKCYRPSATAKEDDVPRFLVCTPSNSAADAFAITLLSRKILPPRLIFRAIASRYEPETFDTRLNDIVKKRGDTFCMPETREELSQFHVIISTIGYCHAMKQLGKKFFSHIIIDEGGQCMEPETFIPVAYYGREETKVVLAGDPQQLGPVITSNFLSNPAFGGYISCLLRLAESEAYKSDPRLMVQLRNNHRSHEYIVDMVSHMFYHDTLRFTRPPGHDSLCRSPILDRSEIPVRFHAVYGREIETAPSFYNPEEMDIVDQYVRKCLSPEHGLKPSDIGVVCPYRESVRRMQAHFQHYKGMTVDTVERFQGSERRVIIMTTVRTDSVGFLQEYRRFNTAITRAKHMLIVIGDPNLLVRDSIWKEFLFYLHNSKCFVANTDDPQLEQYWNQFFKSLAAN